MADANVMDGAGFYNEHSVQQQEAAAAGTAMLARAARDVPLAGNEPIVIADFGAAEGRNSLVPLRAALADSLRVADRDRAHPPRRVVG